jgi:hypothetical protein
VPEGGSGCEKCDLSEVYFLAGDVVIMGPIKQGKGGDNCMIRQQREDEK